MNKENHFNEETPLNFNILDGISYEKEHLPCSELHRNENLLCQDISAIDEVNTEKHNAVIGIIFMLLFVLWMTITHIMIKYLMVIHPYISAFDVTYAISIVASTIYFIIGKSQKLNMNLFTYDRNVILLVVLRVILGGVCNLFFLLSISQIVISKAVLIFSLNPIFWAIQAAIILKERLNFLTIISCISATGGIYLLTLKSQDQDDNKTSIIGYLLMIGSAILTGSIFVSLRYIFKYDIHVWIVSFWATLGFLFQSLILHLFTPSVFHFNEYSFVDLIFLFFIALFACISGLLMSLASKYTKVSRIAPLNNLENILTILSDIFVFHYSFSIYDCLGMLIILVLLSFIKL